MLVLAIITTFVDRFYFLTNIKLANPDKVVKLIEHEIENTELSNLNPSSSSNQTKVDEILELSDLSKQSKEDKDNNKENKENDSNSAKSVKSMTKSEILGDKKATETETKDKSIEILNEPNQTYKKPIEDFDTPENIDEDEQSIYYDYSDELNSVAPTFFNSLGRMCTHKVI